VQRRVINAFLRKIALAVFVVVVVLLICAFGYGLVWLFNQLSPLITAFATAVIAWYTWALRNSTNRLWEAGQRQFELEGPFLHPVIQSHSAIAEGLKFFSIFNHPTSPVGPVASEASFTIRNVGRSPALLKSVAAKMDHWTQMVEEPRIDYLVRYEVEPVIEPGDETKQVFTEPVSIPIDRAAFESLKSGNSHLFLYGEIAFSDLLGEDYVQTFRFAYNFHAKRFVRWAGRYNKRVRATPAKGRRPASQGNRWTTSRWPADPVAAVLGQYAVMSAGLSADGVSAHLLFPPSAMVLCSARRG
jgi:hypothetical protein